VALSGAQRVLLASAAVVVAAGIATVIDGGGARDGSDRAPVAATRERPRVSGPDLAASLSRTAAISTTPITHPTETLERVATQQDVDTGRAWPLEIPEDDRAAWLFAGRDRIALVVPRTVVDPERGAQPDTTSIFGARIADLVDQPLIASQAGGGQVPRILVLVPDGVEPPRIVAHDGVEAIRGMAHRGRLYAGRLRPGEELIVGRRRIGPPTP